MIIAVNARMLLPLLEGIGHYTFEVVDEMAKSHPEDEFHLIFDRKYDSKYVQRPNVHGHVLYPHTRHPLLWHIWFEYRIPGLLNRINADVLFSPEAYLSVKSTIPTLMTVHDLAYLHYPYGSQSAHLRYLQKWMPKFIKRADALSCVSHFTRNDVIAHFPDSASKAEVHYNGVRKIFRPLPESTIHSTRNELTGGDPYFLYLGSMHPRKNIVRLIKAFESFKKRNNSLIKLILAGRMAWNSKEIKEALLKSQVRDSIIHLSNIDDVILPLVGSAEALVYVSLFEGFGLPVLEAMACGVPVITSKNSAMEEIAGECALYADAEDINDISSQMELVTTDDDLRIRLKLNGLNRVSDFGWAKTATSVYDNLRAIMEK